MTLTARLFCSLLAIAIGVLLPPQSAEARVGPTLTAPSTVTAGAKVTHPGELRADEVTSSSSSAAWAEPGVR